MEAALEHRLQLLEQQLLTVDAAYMAAQCREVVLQGEVQRPLAAVASAPAAHQQRAAAAIDTRTLGRPDTFWDDASKWQDWKTVMTARLR